MKGIYLWQRYFLRETLKSFVFFFVCFFLLYSVIDYSIHMHEFKHITISNALYYYGMLVCKRCALFLSLSLLMSTITVLTTCNRRNELLALQTAGIPTYTLSQPFFFIGLLCVSINYANFEFFFPKAALYIDHFENTFFTPNKRELHTAVHFLPLEDGSQLLYQIYDPHKKEFFDVFWVLSTDEIYHMKTLSLKRGYPYGTFVDLFKRNQNGAVEKVKSYDTTFFEALHINFNFKQLCAQPTTNYAISELFQTILNKSPVFYRNPHAIYTHLYFKIVMSFFPILLLIAIIPFCIRLQRTLPTFLIFASSIFSYVAFFMIIQGCVTLGEAQIVSPFWAIFSLPITLLLLCGSYLLRLFCIAKQNSCFLS